MTSEVATAIAVIQTKYEGKMLSLCKIIKKPLLLKNSPSATLLPDFDPCAKASTPSNTFPKLTERWNQDKLGYFDPYLNKTHGDREIVFIKKHVYYRNVVFFVQRLQNLVTFKETALVKASFATFFCNSILECYISKFSNFDCDALNNNPSVKSWISTLSNCFKVPTSIDFGLLIDKIYSLNDARSWRLPTQYVQVNHTSQHRLQY